jgi:hypothetical protein
MYNNHGAALTDKYDVEPRRALFNWWTSLGLMDKELKKQGRFAASKVTSTVLNKGVEMSYNYYEIEPVQIMDELGMVIFSLAFYVIYTLWYGFAILFVFEGWGLRLSHLAPDKILIDARPLCRHGPRVSPSDGWEGVENDSSHTPEMMDSCGVSHYLL